MAKNPFQKAVIDLNLAISGYPDEATLKAQGSMRNIRFLQGNSPKGPGATGGPSSDCMDGDDSSPLQIVVEGFGAVEGKNLDEAVAAAKARISGSADPAPAPAPKKSRK